MQRYWLHGAAAVLKIPHITRSVSSREVDTQLCQGTVGLDEPAQVGKHFKNMSEMQAFLPPRFMTVIVK